MNLDDVLHQPERWARVLGLATLAGIEFGLMGPFGSYASNVFTRIAYWTALFWIGSLLLWPGVVLALRAGPRRGFPPLFSAAAIILALCVPLAIIGAIETRMLWPAHAAGIKSFEYYGLTVLVAMPAMAALLWIELGKPILAALRQRGAAAEAGDAQGKADAAPVPDHLLAAALCVQMEDHHVRVHVPGRSYLHYALMRDVVGALGETRGLQVHRSWWVARDAVRGSRRDHRAVSLILSNGLHVPVARNRVATLRERGWLDAETAPASVVRST